jgi:hypothetical protein
VLSGYITALKNKQKLDVSSEGPSITLGYYGSENFDINFEQLFIRCTMLRAQNEILALILLQLVKN